MQFLIFSGEKKTGKNWEEEGEKEEEQEGEDEALHGPIWPLVLKK